MMMYRLINNKAPKYLTSLFERLSQNTVRELRNTKTDHKLPLLNISSGKIASPIEEHDSGTI